MTDEERIELMARRMASSDGHDENFMVTSATPPLYVLSKQYGFGDPVPIWHLYLRLAKAALAKDTPNAEEIIEDRGLRITIRKMSE